MCNTVYVLLYLVLLPILLTVSQDGMSSRCVLPSYPADGSYVVSGQPNAVPGQTFDIVRLNATCRPGFKLVGQNIILCVDGIWSENLPECIRSCRLDTHPSVKYRCVISGNSSEEGYRDCDLNELVGTVVKPECNAPNYYRSGVLSYMHCLNNGWDYVAVCKPECGTLTARGKEQVAGGRPAEHGELPWHAGIYTKTRTPYQQICGGSLISATVVISAAHCFWNRQEEKLRPASQFAVAVGKLFRLWGDPQDNDTQQFDVSEIKLPDRFRGEGTYFQADLALVVLASPVVYRTYIRPVCMDFNKIFDRRQLQSGKIGKVAGWGLTGANGPPSPVLKVLDTPYVDIDQCIDSAPIEFKQFITSDKICAGFKDGRAVCEGDSGGGLVFPAVDRGIQRYYLRGIVSTAPASDDACNAFEITTYTQIFAHTSFIEENVALFHGEVTDRSAASELSNFCILPPYPKYGKYVVKEEPDAYPGQALPAVHLDIICDPGYAADPNVTLDCSEGWWSDDMPRCARLCKFLGRNPNLLYHCQTNDKGDIRECNDEEPHGTIFKPECKAPYFSRDALPHSICNSGSWDNDQKAYDCMQDCGSVSPALEGRLPWHATIYQRLPNKTEPICGGSLVSETIIITAALCFRNDSTQMSWQPPFIDYENFFVGVGNTRRNFTDSSDSGVQYAEIKYHVVRYKYGERKDTKVIEQINKDTYALVFVKTPIKFTPQVSPVCFAFDAMLDRKQLHEGAVGKVAFSTWDTESISRSFDMSYVDNDTCLEYSEPSIHDRLCVKGSGGTECSFSAPCLLTRGTGLALLDTERAGERYYIRGVLPTNYLIFDAEIEDVSFVHLNPHGF